MSDQNDTCPDTAAGAKVDVHGCTVPEDFDLDDDGVLNVNDKCADTSPLDPRNNRGCSIWQSCPCVRPKKLWVSHQFYALCVAKRVRELYDQGKMTAAASGELLVNLLNNSCGKK